MNNSLQEGGRRAEERGQPRGLGGWRGQGQGGRGPAPRAGASLRQLQRAECWSLRGEQRGRLRGAGRTSKPGPVFPLCWGGGSSGQPAKVAERLRGDNAARRKWAGPAPPGAWRREHSLSHPGRDMGARAWGTGAWAWDVGAGRARGAGAQGQGAGRGGTGVGPGAGCGAGRGHLGAGPGVSSSGPPTVPSRPSVESCGSWFHLGLGVTIPGLGRGAARARSALRCCTGPGAMTVSSSVWLSPSSSCAA